MASTRSGPVRTTQTGRTGTPITSSGSRPASNCPTEPHCNTHAFQEKTMLETTYPRQRTALLLVDPYNDFLSEVGKVYPRIKPIAINRKHWSRSSGVRTDRR